MNLLPSLVLACCLSVLTPLAAAADTRADRYEFHPQINFPPDSTVWTLIPDANVRAEPAITGAIIGKVPIGTEIVVQKSSEAGQDYTQNGLTSGWIKGSFRLDGEMREGYVWGGIVTQLRIRSTANDGVYLYAGIQSATDQDKQFADKATGRIHAARDGVELARLVFDAPNSTTHDAATLSEGSQGLTGVKDVLLINYQAQYCGANAGEVLLFWTGSKFILGKTITKFSDPPVFSIENVILPRDAGGKKGAILVRKEEGGANDETGKVEHTEMASWNWTGSGLQKK